VFIEEHKMTKEQSTQVINWDINKQAIAEVAEDFKDVDAYKDLDGAKEAKKTLTKMRTKLGEAHKETKAEALAFGRAVDAKKNEYLALIKEIEDPITEQLDEIKNKAAREEAERMAFIDGYIDGIRMFANDRHSLTLDELLARREELQSRGLDSEVTQERHEEAQLAFDESDMKLRITIQNEKERLEEEEKQAKVAAENALLQAELAERQRKMDEEDAERQALRDAEDKERLAKEYARNAEIKAEQDKIAEEQAAAQKLIDDENDRLAKEKAEREAEEERKNLEAEAEARALEQAPDREKLLFFANLVDSLIGAQPILATDTAKEILQQANAMLIEVAYDIRKSTEEMK
jgi:hypothetical protein